MGQASDGVEPLDEHLEGHILVFVGGQGARLHLGQQLGDGGIPGQIDPQHQGVRNTPPAHRARGRGAPRSGTPPQHRNWR